MKTEKLYRTIIKLVGYWSYKFKSFPATCLYIPLVLIHLVDGGDRSGQLSTIDRFKIYLSVYLGEWEKGDCYTNTPWFSGRKMLHKFNKVWTLWSAFQLWSLLSKELQHNCSCRVCSPSGIRCFLSKLLYPFQIDLALDFLTAF